MESITFRVFVVRIIIFLIYNRTSASSNRLFIRLKLHWSLHPTKRKTRNCMSTNWSCVLGRPCFVACLHRRVFGTQRRERSVCNIFVPRWFDILSRICTTLDCRGGFYTVHMCQRRFLWHTISMKWPKCIRSRRW